MSKRFAARDGFGRPSSRLRPWSLTPDASPEVIVQHLVPDAAITERFSYRWVKRAIDVAGAAGGLMLLSPLLLLLALLIKMTSRGPAFFPWDVIGRGGHPFRGYKLRTMVVNAHELRDELTTFNEMQGPVFKMRDDPRVTSVGRVLRRYSLDELPQLWSVLKGDMSLVGPRPAGTWEWPNFEAWQRAKLSVRPGITCLWQISGRNSIASFDEWVRLDLSYINSWSLWLDAKIIARTLLVVARGTGH